MKILFAAGGFSSGGIADYSKLLAGELRARGQEVDFLPLSGPETAAEGAARGARDKIAAFRPDWISLQFNPFALQPRGLLWSKRRALAALLRGQKLHVMVHEVWLGIADQRGWKPRLIGALQKPAVTGLLRDLRPRLIHTSNPYYQDVLGRSGLKAELLPLFGNVPPLPGDTAARRDLLGADAREDVFRLGLFSGQIGARLPASLIGALHDHAAARGQRLAVISAGRAAGIDALFAAWRNCYPEVSFNILGERPQQELSQFMQAMDAALTHYPYYLCGKSGVAAAWLEHGVPLLTTWGDLTPGVAPVPSDVMALLRRPEEPLAGFLARQGARRPRGHRLPEVADQLIAELAAASQASKS